MSSDATTLKTRPVRTLAETLEILRSNIDAIKSLGATALYVFGSAARDELGPESDVDVFIDYDPQGPFSFVELFDMRDLIASALMRRVDLTSREGLHPRLRRQIEASAIRVI